MRTLLARPPARRLMACGLLLLAAVCASGCLVISLQPYYDDASIAFDEGLLGAWVDGDHGDTYTLERGAWNTYRIVIAEAGKAKGTVLMGVRMKLGDRFFIDVSPESGAEPGPYLVPVHGLFQVERTDDRLTIRALSYDYFKDAAEKKKLTGLAFAFDRDHDVVLTSDTRALREWIAANFSLAGVLDDATTLVRKKPEDGRR